MAGARCGRSAAWPTTRRRRSPTVSSPIAAYVFFSYIGFDTATTTAEECKNPQFDVPVGVIGALAIGTIIYCATAIVLVGAVPWSQVPIKNPLVYALAPLHMPALNWVITIGVLAGTTSVALGSLLGPIADLLRDGARRHAAADRGRRASALQNAAGHHDDHRSRGRGSRTDRSAQQPAQSRQHRHAHRLLRRLRRRALSAQDDARIFRAASACRSCRSSRSSASSSRSSLRSSGSRARRGRGSSSRSSAGSSSSSPTASASRIPTTSCRSKTRRPAGAAVVRFDCVSIARQRLRREDARRGTSCAAPARALFRANEVLKQPSMAGPKKSQRLAYWSRCRAIPLAATSVRALEPGRSGNPRGSRVLGRLTDSARDHLDSRIARIVARAHIERARDGVERDHDAAAHAKRRVLERQRHAVERCVRLADAQAERLRPRARRRCCPSWHRSGLGAERVGNRT